DEANDSEDSPVPSKKPASEEAISKQFSSLNISTPSSNSFCDEVEMLPLDKISDEVDSDESDVEESLRLPEELCKAYNLLKTTGSLPDPHLQKIFASKPCLAVVPYVPRPTLPLLPASDAPARDNPMPDPDTADDSDSAEPMESQSISSALYMPNLPVDWTSDDFRLSSQVTEPDARWMARIYRQIPCNNIFKLICPSLRWYFGEISREKTNEILLNQPIGTFLIRDSSTTSGFVLSIKLVVFCQIYIPLRREATKVVRYLINYCNETNDFNFGNLNFESLEAVLEYYSQGKTSACFMVKPAPKERLLALFDFAGEKDDDLPLSKGDMVAFLIQKKDWILCSLSDGRRGWVPSNHLAPYNAELLASLKVDKGNLNSMSYCSLCGIINVPTNAKVIRSRQPSIFQVNHLEIQENEPVRVERVLNDGICEIWLERLHFILRDFCHGFACNPFGSLPAVGRAAVMSNLARLGKLVASRTALFVCDIQDKFRPAVAHFDAIVSVTERLISAAKMLDVPVVVTEMYPKGLGQTVRELGDLTDIPVIPKTSFSMVTKEVESKIDLNKGIDSVILCGLETHVCIQRTALDLLERGIDVHCVADAVSSRFMVDRMFALERMRQSGVFITTSESAILGLMSGAEHPMFKQVQKLILPEAPDSGLLSSPLAR
ncbi:unnamed protein product, partial [Mesocestoides corti]